MHAFAVLKSPVTVTSPMLGMFSRMVSRSANDASYGIFEDLYVPETAALALEARDTLNDPVFPLLSMVMTCFSAANPLESSKAFLLHSIR